MTDLQHLSYSSISMFLDCPEAWQRKYIAKEQTMSSPALAFGSAFHNSVERFVANKATKTNEDESLLGMWGAEWKAASSDDKNIFWDLDTPEEHYNEGVRLLSDSVILKGIEQIDPMLYESKEGIVSPMIEQRVELRVPGVPIPIIGFIDVILDDGTPADLKTSRAKWSETKASDSLQSLFYLAALNQAGFEINWKFTHFIFVKTKTPAFQVIEHSHKPSELFFLFELIARVWDGIEKEVFTINPTSWRCNVKYCDFWGNCRGKALAA
ncbi:MAG: PD-(D/E)XK nuclease family protein [Anaerolineaceae bacterium]